MPYLPIEVDCLLPYHSGPACPHCGGTGKRRAEVHYRGRKKLSEEETALLTEFFQAIARSFNDEKEDEQNNEAED